MAIKQLGLCHPSSKWCPEPHLARLEALLLPAHAQTGPGFVPSRPVGELTVAQEIPTVSCGETTGKRGYRYQKNKHLLNKEPSFSHWQFFRWLPWRVFKWTNKHQDISVIQHKNGDQTISQWADRQPCEEGFVPFHQQQHGHFPRSEPLCDNVDTGPVSRRGGWHLMSGHPIHILREGPRHLRHSRGPPARWEQYNPSHRHSCQSWLIIAGSQASLRHFVIVTLIILKDVFLGKDICCAAQSSKKQLLEARSGCCFCVHYWQWFINGRVFVIIEFPRV